MHVFERWESLLVHSSQALPGAVDDLIRRTHAFAAAGLYNSDVKITDIFVRRQAGGGWECSLSDFDAPYCGASATATPGTLAFMTLLPMTFRFACFGQNWRLPIAAQIVEAVHALSNSSRPRREDFMANQIGWWHHKLSEAKSIFRRHGDRNTTGDATGTRIVGLCRSLYFMHYQ